MLTPATRAAVLCSFFCTTLSLDPTWLIRVKDGDTFVIRNAGITNSEDVRVCQLIEGAKAWCVNTPESGEEGATEATLFTASWLQQGPFTVTACKRDAFGRLLGMVTRGDSNLGQALLDEGHAVPYKRKSKSDPAH